MVLSHSFQTLHEKQKKKHYFFLSFHLYLNFVLFKQKEMLYWFMYIAALYINMMINSAVERFFDLLQLCN